ncbi:MAG: sulfatase [Bryobacteraceae bacterium]
MNRRQFLFSAAAAFAPPARRPNIVLILADDLGWADTTPYGGDLHETPNLERLAAQGMRFTHAYAAAPVCSPTRASIHTGKYPARLHITIWREAAHNPPRNRAVVPPMAEEDLPQRDCTLAEALRDNGYFTAHIGKWHLGNAENYPEVHGFDVNIGGTLWGAPQTYFWPYRGSKRFGGEYRYVPGLHGGKPEEYLTDRLTTEAINQIDAAGGRPFFLNLCHHAVHTPIEGKPALVERYKSRIRPGLRHQNAAYAAMVQNLDENVGRILDHLDRRGLASNTAVIFFSDNGGYINQVTDNYPLRSGKGSLYEGGIRVPLIVRWPGITRAGSASAQRVCSTDLYPTILEAAALRGDPAQNAAMDGRSVANLLRDPSATLSRDELFFHYPHYYHTTTPVSAIIARDWKLLEYLEDGRVELYNLAADPSETRDLARENSALAEKLRARLHAWRAEVKAQMPARP